MIEENSGKFFRFKLDFNLGFGFAEAYDFRNINSFDGSLVFVYNRIDKDIQKAYILEDINSSGIALGPIRLVNYPNSRGQGAWKFLLKSNNYIIQEPNITKDAQDLTPLIDDWNTLKRWHISNSDLKEPDINVPYETVRLLETHIINTMVGVIKKTTMKILIDKGMNVNEYYDLSQIGNRNMFNQLINTYYPLGKTKELLSGIPPLDLSK